MLHAKGPISHCLGAKKVQHIFHFPLVEVENVQFQHNLPISDSTDRSRFPEVRSLCYDVHLLASFNAWQESVQHLMENQSEFYIG